MFAIKCGRDSSLKRRWQGKRLAAKSYELRNYSVETMKTGRNYFVETMKTGR